VNNVNYPSGVRGPMDGEAGKSFTLPSRYYFDADIYQRELQQVFHRSWCYVGHVSQIPNPGDYYVDKIADQCVFIMRTDEATVKAFFNVCQHRGHQLLNGKGNTKKRIVCPYHAWTYKIDGTLLNAPYTDKVAGFNHTEFSLKEIALANYRGMLFANLDSNAPNFTSEYKGFDTTILDHLPSFEIFAIAHQFEYEIAANWKIVVDNFSEGYHIPVAHKQLSRVLDTSANKKATIEPRFSCFRSASKEGYAGLELEPGAPYLSWTVWPNTCMLSQPGCDNLIVIRMAPNGPTQCRERIDILTPYGEGSSNLDALCRLFSDNFNKEDISLVESVQQGLQSLGYDQSRYVADDRNDWYSESGLHRFHLQILEAIG